MKPSSTDGLLFLHIAAFIALAISQPLLDAVAKQPQFLVARNLAGAEFFFLAFLCLLLPCLLTFLLLLLRRVNERFAALAIALFVFAMTSLCILNVLQKFGFSDSPEILAGITFFAASLFSFAYQTIPTVRQFISYMSILAVIAPLYFVYKLSLFSDPYIDKKSVSFVGKPTPIVWIVFDELPLKSLLTQEGEIDAARFPAFFSLASSANWYRNATTPHWATHVALPAMLTGNTPPPNEISWGSISNHPQNVFTLLAQHTRVHAYEPITRLCPTTLCEKFRDNSTGLLLKLRILLEDSIVLHAHMVLPEAWRRNIPAIEGRWHGFVARETQSRWKREVVSASPRFTEGLQHMQANDFHFLHLMLPHSPWVSYPSGRRYVEELNEEIRGQKNSHWGQGKATKRQINVALQRHKMQLAYVDSLLGNYIDAIKASGLWQDALVIVTADHGASFIEDTHFRVTSSANVDDIAYVPLLIKYPQQSSAKIIDDPTDTVAILPTIIDTIEANCDCDFSAKSLLNEETRETSSRQTQGTKRMLTLAGTGPTRRHHRSSLFSDSQGPAFYFDISDEKKLLGKPVSKFERFATSMSIAIAQLSTFDRIDTTSQDTILPGRILAKLSLGPATADLEAVPLAFAVNGIIQASTSIPVNEGEFELILPEASLKQDARPGKILLEVFLRETDTTGKLRLAKLSVSEYGIKP